MFQAIFQLFLFRGSPADVNGNVPTIATFATLLVAFTWLMLPTSNTFDLSPDILREVRQVLFLIPILQHAFAALMIFTVLNIRKSSARFAKTVSAYLGVHLVFQVCEFSLGALSGFLPTFLGFILTGAQFILFVWLFGVLGHIYRHAFNIKFYQGVLAGIGIMILSYFLAGIITGLMFPDEVQKLGELMRRINAT